MLAEVKGEKVAAKAWDVLPIAFASLLIADAELWDKMRNYRNDTSHEYNEQMAIEISAFVRSQAVQAFETFRSEMQPRI